MINNYSKIKNVSPYSLGICKKISADTTNIFIIF